MDDNVKMMAAIRGIKTGADKTGMEEYVDTERERQVRIITCFKLS